MTDAFALLLAPGEAAALVPGWPPDAWLVAFGGGLGGWDAVGEREIPATVGLLPVWPPLGSLPIADVGAGEEVLLIGRIARQPGLAEAARGRIAPSAPCPREVGPDDVDW